jgi:ribonucleoside-diphosphate reductase alpha chain
MSGIPPISQRIWDLKYRFKTAGGTPVDATPADTWQRVAAALAAGESDPARWTAAFRDALDGFTFLPAGRILAGAGTGRAVTLFNCFVMGTVDDDLGGIFAHLREAALTLQQGGGIGCDFSPIRPKGAEVIGIGADASGPLSFMDVWDSMCRTIMSAGARRGAMMATLRCDHPDIEEFIEAKRHPGRLRMFNLSVLATDAFMAAVRDDAPWPLTFAGTVTREVPARALWRKLMQATYEVAEPGVIFIDRVNQANNLAYVEAISATNPCGEQPLPPHGACLLGSLNLASLVLDPFQDSARLDLDRLRALVPVAVRMLDNAIDASRFPLEAQANEARAKRRLGLGVTGLADALIMLGARYGGERAVALTRQWLAAIRDEAYRASAGLAAEKGPFPLWQRDRYLQAPMVRALPVDIQELVARHGVRNALLTSIAPTGTISLLAGNVSSGIEPVFAFTFERTMLLPDGSRRTLTVSDPAFTLFRERFGPLAALPDGFVDVQGLTPRDHLVMQAAAQEFVDSSISKTINCPPDLSFDDFASVYFQAWEMGCKGCTTFRPNPVTGAVLARGGAGGGDEVADGAGSDLAQPMARPETLPGETYKVRWPDSDHAMYITINDIVQDGGRRPFEVFINSKNMEHYAWTVALTRMISAVFRRGGDVGFVVEELKAVFDPRGGAWIQGRYVPSLLAAIGDAIERHMHAIGFLAADDSQQATHSRQAAGNRPAPARSCPKCGQPGLIRQEGCGTCTNCDYSRCGP